MPSFPVETLRRLCPDYPSTSSDLATIPVDQILLATEKLDGANAALFLHDSVVQVRNRTHVLRPGYWKDTPAKAQFRPLMGWAPSRKSSLVALAQHMGGPVAVYGEWLWAVHGVRYTELPHPFVAWGLWACTSRRFVDPLRARALLEAHDWRVPPLVGQGLLNRQWLSSRVAHWGEELAEGVVLTWGDGGWRRGVVKWVDASYVQNSRWNATTLVRQPVRLPR